MASFELPTTETETETKNGFADVLTAKCKQHLQYCTVFPREKLCSEKNRRQ